MDEIIVNNLPENTSPTAADMLMLIRTADGELTQVSVEDLGDVIGATEIFLAVYDATTSAQIEAAAAVGKVVMCVYSGHFYRLQEIDSTNHYAYFCCWEDGAAKFDLICDNDTWDASTSPVGTYSKPSGGIPKTDLASAVQTSLGKADSALQSESDPTVPSWAKQQSKPSYTKSEVGLGNVDNVKQYSASNPPPYPVSSVNGQTGAVVLSIPASASDVGAIAAPSSPATGAFLVWNGSAWVAQTLSTWQGGSY